MTATTQQPVGVLGTYTGHTGNLFHVILDRDNTLWWHEHDTARDRWVPMRGWDADNFEPDPDVPSWVADCPHTPVCYDGRDETNERDCLAMRVASDTERWGD